MKNFISFAGSIAFIVEAKLLATLTAEEERLEDSGLTAFLRLGLCGIPTPTPIVVNCRRPCRTNTGLLVGT